MGVLMQAFYWDCPQLESVEMKWWRHVAQTVPALERAGFTALWLPPPSKAFHQRSMGYDPYDYYDLGEFDQKGGVPTWFGSRDELRDLIGIAHAHRLQVLADLVINHNSGADEREFHPLLGEPRWTRFKPASGRFERNWESFNPCNFNDRDEGTFGDMPDLCHFNPTVYAELLGFSRWLIEEIGFDGFRYDMVKGFGSWLVSAIQQIRYRRPDGTEVRPFGVGEFWASAEDIRGWLDTANRHSRNGVTAFDFPLRSRLKALCDGFGFDLRELTAPGTLLADRPWGAVTFAENHDVALSSPIVNDKMLAYAVILTHEGYPCVFWEDYFRHGLGQAGGRNGIAALVRAHEDHAGGRTEVLHADRDLYLMQRTGHGSQSGLVLVLNNRGDRWEGRTVRTRWPARRLEPVAWRGRDDLGAPLAKATDGEGRVDLWAPPRGYAVYAPS